jgi:periplasmic protein TonB
LPGRHVFRQVASAALTMPTMIPKKVVEVKDIAAPDVGGGAAGGVAGGENGGTLGGVLGGIGNGPAPPPPPAAVPKKSVLRVGGDVKPPRQIVHVPPDYPIIAQKGRIEGVVEVDALIDEQGNVAQARAVSGPAMLMPAAVKAVMKWKYEPTYLDGMAVSIEMKVEVSFHLNAN